MEEVATAAAKEAVTVASTGNLAALLVFVLILGAGVVVVLGVALIRERGKRREDASPPPACPPPGGCPEVSKISAQVEALTREMQADRAERREHRQEVRESVRHIHDRLDDTVTQGELTNALTASQHAQEEMNRVLAAITSLVETVRTAPTRRRATSKRTAS